MSEATAFENAIPDGWYDDPAKPDMERWWSGTEWTDHVRYTNKVRRAPIAPAPAAAEPAPYEFTPTWPVAVTPDRPQLAIASTAAYAFPSSSVTSGEVDPASGFNDSYIPMRQIQSRAGAGARLIAPRRSARVILVWVAIIAAVGVASGLAVWVLLPR